MEARAKLEVDQNRGRQAFSVCGPSWCITNELLKAVYALHWREFESNHRRVLAENSEENGARKSWGRDENSIASGKLTVLFEKLETNFQEPQFH